MILDLLYPPSCLHCNQSLNEKKHFCSDCLEHFTLIAKEGRCTKCFSQIPMMRGVCKSCRKISHPFRQFAACFDAYGPAQSLLNAFLKRQYFYLAKEIAAYFIVQLEALHFPKFDVIVAHSNVFQNPQFLIAKQMAKMMDCPSRFVLKRRLLQDPTYILKKGCNIINKSVLLLDVYANSRRTIRSAAWTLHSGWVENVYGMTFCVT